MHATTAVRDTPECGLYFIGRERDYILTGHDNLFCLIVDEKRLTFILFFLSTVPDLPSLPINVSYVFILSEQNITARFRWKPPSSSLHPITGYNIIWAEPRPDPADVHVFGKVSQFLIWRRGIQKDLTM